MRGPTMWMLGAVVVIVASCIVYQAIHAAPQSPSIPRSASPYGQSVPVFCQTSSPSCAAAACHGGGEVGRKGSEHSTWSPNLLAEKQNDPHSHSYSILSNRKSLEMTKALGLKLPFKAELCLKCHSVPDLVPKIAVSEGVSCGACHGPAEKWLAAHVEPSWKTLNNREKLETYGFLPGTNLVARNLTCVKCHVGDSEREVNHDLIAAGHPRLAFESSQFHYQPSYRKHWGETEPDFELRNWYVGQVVGLRAATELLRVRAERAAKQLKLEGVTKSPWPEFAGLNCYSCHKSADLKSAIITESRPRKSLAIPAWETWSNATFDALITLRTDFYPESEPPRLDDIIALQKAMDRRTPDANAIAAQSAKALAQLDAWLASMQRAEDSGKLEPLAKQVPGRIVCLLAVGVRSCNDRESFSAAYHGSAAAFRAGGGRERLPEWAEAIRGLEGQLKANSTTVCVKFDPEEVRSHFQALAAAASRSKP